ncbi:MAG: DUF192 domain-containing protein [Gammaproteobacteria bacterium]|nr:DUF192 domain-containing protein [Gammaproteobacteria bacterium]
MEGRAVEFVYNQRNNALVGCNIRQADSFRKRLLGLLGQNRLQAGQGLWLKPCRGIHTIGMRHAIDVVFLDARHRVVGIERGVPPNRIRTQLREARSVLELPPGTIGKADIRLGDGLVAEHAGCRP